MILNKVTDVYLDDGNGGRIELEDDKLIPRGRRPLQRTDVKCGYRYVLRSVVTGSKICRWNT